MREGERDVVSVFGGKIDRNSTVSVPRDVEHEREREREVQRREDLSWFSLLLSVTRTDEGDGWRVDRCGKMYVVERCGRQHTHGRVVKARWLWD